MTAVNSRKCFGIAGLDSPLDRLGWTVIRQAKWVTDDSFH
jgi:hypothetical protein